MRGQSFHVGRFDLPALTNLCVASDIMSSEPRPNDFRLRATPFVPLGALRPLVFSVQKRLG